VRDHAVPRSTTISDRDSSVRSLDTQRDLTIDMFYGIVHFSIPLPSKLKNAVAVSSRGQGTIRRPDPTSVPAVKHHRSQLLALVAVRIVGTASTSW
jgi:hypothetical protein